MVSHLKWETYVYIQNFLEENMKNNNSDMFAAAMDAILKSAEHKSLFNPTYKVACDLNDVKDSTSDSSSSSSSSSSDTQSADDTSDSDESDSSCADDSSMESDSANVDDCSSEDSKCSTASYDVAIDSLLTASAALDSIGFEKSATISLQLASFIVEAKKKEVKKDKKKDMKKDKKDSKKDSKSTSTKSTSSKSTSKSTSSKSTKPVKK
jgi:hypothetical protein